MYLCLIIDLNDNEKYFHANKKYIYIIINIMDKQHNYNSMQVIKMWKQQRSILLLLLLTRLQRNLEILGGNPEICNRTGAYSCVASRYDLAV